MWNGKILCVKRRKTSTCCRIVGRQTFVASSARLAARVSGHDHSQRPFPLAFSGIRIFAKSRFAFLRIRLGICIYWNVLK